MIGYMFLGVLTLSILWFIYRLPAPTPQSSRTARSPRREPRPTEDVYVSSADIDEMVYFISEDRVQTDEDPRATTRHPGWSTRHAISVLSYAGVVSGIDRVRVVECEGAWLRPSEVVLIVQPGQDRFEVLNRARRADEEGARSSHVYLSRDDVFALAHHSLPIPLNHGYHRRHVANRYPGWTWEELHGVLRKGGLLCKRASEEWVPRHLTAGAVGVLVSRSGETTLDDGSLSHPARTVSWKRGGKVRLSEHCERRSHGGSGPVIIHAPHTSVHIPASVRSELLIDDEALQAELAAMTDAGVADVLSEVTWSPTDVVLATMSRLVIDPERFAEDDPMEAVGMGLVYTKRADGSPLRETPTPKRLAWYRAQHRAYTESMERRVEDVLARFGGAVILDLHSYSTKPLSYEDSTNRRPEVCIGTDPYHTPEWLQTAALTAFTSGFDVGVNTPFSGSYVPGRFYRSESQVASLMVEVRRDVLLTVEGVAAVATAVARVVEEATTRLTGREAGR